MNFTLPCDYKIETLDKLFCTSVKYGNRVVEVYGNLPKFMPIGNGRGYIASNEKLKVLEKYVRYAAGKGIEFNYTINASCTENLELISSGQKRIVDGMDRLISMGIKKYTVASIPLVKLLRYIYKDKIKITLSTIANVNSVNKAVQAEKLGVDAIVLGEDETRNIPLIKNIRKSVKCDIEIIVNSMCLWNCLYRQSHYNSLAHMKKEKQTETSFYPNQCYIVKRDNPVERIKSPWIRPEDLSKYNELGIDLFKIIGREISQTADWTRMLEIYCKGDYDGNLSELLYGFSEKGEIYLDNKSFEGFVDYFFNNEYKCFDICGTGKCNYCQEYYENAIRI